MQQQSDSSINKLSGLALKRKKEKLLHDDMLGVADNSISSEVVPSHSTHLDILTLLRTAVLGKGKKITKFGHRRSSPPPHTHHHQHHHRLQVSLEKIGCCGISVLAK